MKFGCVAILFLFIAEYSLAQYATQQKFSHDIEGPRFIKKVGR